MNRVPLNWRFRRAGWLLAAALVVASGCSRAFYRAQADREIYTLIDRAAADPRWPLEGYTIEVAPQSRMFDPTAKDHPPMPPDDPTSHRLMHCVDCKRGYPCWHADGDIPFVENPDWPACLVYEDDGAVVLDMAGAVQLALLNSDDYQTELENLYLSALDVSFERFRFDTQFFGGNDTFFTADGQVRGGGRARSQLSTDTDLQMRRMFATGGEMVVGLANSFVWEFSGANSETAFTLLDFSLVQPLLRAGGRAQVMERLTLAERTLLANVRQMERFRRGFYAEITTGINAGQGPSRRGGVFGGSGFEGFQGVGGAGFGTLGGGGGGGGAAGFTGGAGAQGAGGYLGLLQTQQEIRNQEANVAGLRESVEQLEAAYAADRIDRLQVEQAGQALYNAQSVLLTSKAGYQTELDQFKSDLGLPPDIDIKIEDAILKPFELIDPEITALQDAVARLIGQLRNPADAPGLDNLEQYATSLENARQRTRFHFDAVQQDIAELDENLDKRAEELRAFAQREEFARGELDPEVYSPENLLERSRRLKEDFALLSRSLQATLDRLEGLQAAAADADLAGLRPQWIEALRQLNGQLLQLSLVQARARLDTVTLVPIDLDSCDAFHIAQVYRRDLMNARAGLVDVWRLIEFNANDLESSLDLVFEGDLGTTGDNPVRFRSTNGRLRVGFQFDAPLTRLQERNNYREALISYQQARRSFYGTQDGIYQGLRNTLRQIELNRVNFELRRAAVDLAIRQVDLARLRLSEPPRPGEVSQLSSTTARDLITALTDLLNVQNEFLSVWVNYEVQRLALDFGLGTMELDHRGIWIDPGEIGPDTYDVSGDCHDELGAEAFEAIAPGEIVADDILPDGVEEFDGPSLTEPMPEGTDTPRDELSPEDGLPPFDAPPRPEGLDSPQRDEPDERPPLATARGSRPATQHTQKIDRWRPLRQTGAPEEGVRR